MNDPETQKLLATLSGVTVSAETAKVMCQQQWWIKVTARDAAVFQIQQATLCMPMGDFARVVSEALGRRVQEVELFHADTKKEIMQKLH